jgi:hypothetical protein
MKYLIILSFLFFYHDLIGQSSEKDEIIKIIDQIEYGWENGDGKPFNENFLDFNGAKYFESGGQNIGLNDLILNHVEPEKDALFFLDLNYFNINVFIENNFAWVTADTEINGKIKKNDLEINKTGHQTYIFRKIDGKWKVIHSHSSSRDRSNLE